MLNIVFEECTKRNMLHNNKCVENGVVCIGYALNIGDIRQIDLFGNDQKKFLDLEYVEYDNEQIEQIFKEQTKDVEILLKTIKAGKNVRIWRSNEPHNICAFLLLCDFLYEYEINVYCVDLPSEYLSWSHLESKMFPALLSNSYMLSAEEINHYRNTWRMLQEENAPLRAIVDGKITSVSEDFYDAYIQQNIPKKECSIGTAIGNLLRTNTFGISDAWLFLRIKKLIEAGKIQIVHMCERNSFETIIKLVELKEN